MNNPIVVDSSKGLSAHPMKKDTRTLLLEVGTEMISAHGFNSTGIAEVLKAAGVPKGSFYHYFDSKDDFGMQVIDHFCIGYFEWIEQFLGDRDHTPLTRLRALIQDYMVRFKAKNYVSGCLFGSLSQEMAGQNEVSVPDCKMPLKSSWFVWKPFLLKDRPVGKFLPRFAPESWLSFI